MKAFTLCLSILLTTGVASAQSYSHNYERFFGKDDRLDIHSDAAEQAFSKDTLNTIRANSLLINCGTSDKPSTAFIADNKIYSAAHNLALAKRHKQDCIISTVALSEGEFNTNFKDDGTISDAAHDIASWKNITHSKGFKICENLTLKDKYILVQSMDGSGRLGVSPVCKTKSIRGNLITTNCRAHYKASGGPLLKVSKGGVCVAGVFNAHSGKRFGYESYAAKLSP